MERRVEKKRSLRASPIATVIVPKERRRMLPIMDHLIWSTIY